MAKYIKLFETDEEYLFFRNSVNFITPNVSVIKENDDKVLYNKIYNYSEQYFTIQSLGDDNQVSFTNDIEFSEDGSSWDKLTSGESLVINSGDTVMFKITDPSINTNGYGVGTFSTTKRYNVKGNVMSLLYGDNFMDKTDLTPFGTDVFNQLFYGSTTLFDASDLILPATILTERCYQSMFYGCTSLTTAPELPATTLANYCYRYMFRGCSSLTTAPELPATTLAEYCYYSMFEGCTKLTTAPELPATTLTNYCYNSMLKGCKSLTTAPELPATTLTHSCYREMFRGCTSLTTSPELPATTLANSCYNYMFYGCTSLTTAPSILPATTLANYCYEYMFQGCTSLTTAPELPSTTLAERCYSYMFYGCTNLNYIKILATDFSATDCLSNWVSGVASTGTFVKNISAVLLSEPSGWDVVKIDSDDYLNLTLSSTRNNAFGLVNSGNTVNLLYSTDKINWIETSGFTMKPYITYYLKGTNVGGFSKSGSQYSYFTFRYNDQSTTIESHGNIMSLLYDDGFKESNTLLRRTHAFYMLFGGAPLTTAPKLPATTLTNSCYSYMFFGCAFLTTAPELPATTLADYCYENMFYGCKALTTAPELPATTLASSCYLRMFNGCTSLTTAPELPATTLANRCYENMFTNCTLLTTAPELPATTLAERCYQSMFAGCTSLTTAPELPATTLATYCYYIMFSRCIKLNYITMLATDISASNCLSNWVDGVASTGTFIKNTNMLEETIGRGVSGIPEGWTVNNYE